ncbi:hypothetical protein [Streptomyces sp. CC77]|uniref:hypothetical protein n=1 Tax=Streptomyces sp. CC77 TaxID=1906739 RepID=UPI0008DE3F4D|nr:hypothetical protein [Streptomyces sp. CC77]OII67047.1 hypothetical protein BJP39_26275 [Streptomyces sp. CC77]
MNIRSLTRGDGVVIGAAVVLFIASFLSLYSYECQAGLPCVKANAWDNLGLVMSMNIAGIVGAALIVVSRAMPGRKVVNLDLGQFGVALTVFALWTAFWTILDAPSAGAGLILGLLASIALAGGAVASPMVGALKAPLVSATPKPQGAAATPPPYGGQPGAPAAGGYGYPGGAAQPYPGAGAPGGGYGYPGGQAAADPAAQGAPQGGHAQAAAAPEPAPAADFAPFWFAVPVARPLYAEDGSGTPVADLAPGTWYLAVEQRGAALVAQTQDGRRGVLQDTTGIQRG